MKKAQNYYDNINIIIIIKNKHVNNHVCYVWFDLNIKYLILIFKKLSSGQ